MHRCLHALSAPAAIVALGAALLAPAAHADDHALTKDQATELAKQMAENEVRLVNAGSGKKAARRYAPEVGDTTTMTLTTTTNITQSMNDRPMPSQNLPATQYTLNVEVTEVEGDTFTLTTTVVNAGIDPDSDAQDRIRQAMQGMLDALKDRSSTTTLSTRGVVNSVDWANANQLNPQTRTQLDQIDNNNPIVALPEEPIGTGAVWRHKRTVDSNGITVHIIANYTLEDIDDGGDMILSVDIRQVIPDQEVNPPNMPAGATVKVNNASGTGSGNLRVDASTAVSHTVDMTMDISMASDIDMQGQSMSMQQEVDVAVTAEPVEG